MPSIFSRSRTNSTPHKKLSLPSPDATNGLGPLDEFGRVSSRSSNRGISNVNIPASPPSKKDKKKAKEQEKRLRTLSTTREREYDQAGVESPPPSLPDGSFLPLNLERPRDEFGGIEPPKDHDYGYLSYERHVVLGLEQVARLVDVVADELGTRGGLTTPFIFTSLALDISSSAIKRLIQAFLRTCGAHPGQSAGDVERRWREEARFAGPHELGMCLRWGLARVVRSYGGQDVRGLISWDQYNEFRDSEAALQYPPSHFASFLPNLVPPLRSIILQVLTLLTRLTANSTSSGHTPPTLSPLFGPLFFGLGPATLAFHHTYVHYLRSTNAMEHLLLAFIRWQDNPRPTTSSSASTSIGELNAYGSAAALGVPTRLKEWIKGYPAMLPFLQDRHKNEKPQARRGARTVRVMSVRRNVRMYSPDLVKSVATWAQRSKPGVGSPTDRGLAGSKEWDRIAPATLRLPPRYSESYKKRMDMPPNFHPDTGPGTGSQTSVGRNGMASAPSTSSYSSTTSSGTSASLLEDKDYFGMGLGGREGEDRFRSLTDLKWGEFEAMGFGGLGVDDEKKLQFDLTESARTTRAAKRATLSWNDFSSSGFSRGDDPLSATLQFSTPLTNTISSWPSHNAEMSKKLKKSQKALPPFGWDTEPVMGNEEVIEEAFVDVFCDLVYGGGWMDLERGEELDRDCNWALVEFKSLPPSRSTASGGSDPRTATTLILFEEFVPLEYRQQLATAPSSRPRLPSLFSQSGKSKQWKQAPTLNGRPYVVGHVPRSPSYREVEFEGLLRGGTATKVISLGSKAMVRAPAPSMGPSRVLSTVSTINPNEGTTTPRVGISNPLYLSPRPETPPPPPPMKGEELHSDSTMSPSMKKSRFRLPGGIPVPSPGGGRKTGMAPAEYSSVDFETRLASYSDDEHNGERAYEPEAVKQKRRESKDDAWVDILVATHNRRLGGQDADVRPGEKRRGGVRGRRSDPELASLEVAQALAAFQNRSPSPPTEDERVHHSLMEPLNHNLDVDVDEIETVPRTSGGRSISVVDNDALEYVSSDPEPVEEEEVDEEAEETQEEDKEEPMVESPLSKRHLAKQQRRLGYFDLHPERRPTGYNADDDDPRHRLAYADSDEDDGDDEDIYGPPEDTVPPRVPPKVPTKQISPSNDIHSGLFSSPALDISDFDQGEERNRAERERSFSQVDSVILSPVSVTNGHGHENGNGNGNGNGNENGNDVVPKVVTPSKTAALIEMYRERERSTPTKPAALPSLPPLTVPAPLQPSRLPVRSHSLPQKETTLPAPPTQPAAPSPKSAPPEIDLIDPPRVPLEETGRASPARYVHGAPLHNVLEEEEEEA